MFTSILTGAILGLEAHIVRAEVDISPGLPCFQMVGYLSNEVKEAKERVRVALKNSGYALPAMCLNVNLSPADMRKEGTSYDLPVAIGILSSMDILPEECLKNTMFVGELGLNGELRKVKGVLPLVQAAKKQGISRVILPEVNASEGLLVPDIQICSASSLLDVISILIDPDNASDHIKSISTPASIEEYLNNNSESQPDFEDVYGQDSVKRAAMVAAAGFHHMLMIGPPGAGKTMIAKRIPSILPRLTVDESLEVTGIYSVAGLLKDNQALISVRPFLSPHHTITTNALAGGGRIPRPGVISLSHRGVLFLDELTEFNRATLDIMRQPLEDKEVYISRAHGTYHYPASFMLVAACNPCPCGHYPNRNLCRCSDNQVKNYLNKISGPILDRIDICCDVEAVDLCKPHSSGTGSSSKQMSEKVSIARARQEDRFRDTTIRFNADMNPKDIDKYCMLGPNEQLMLQSAYEPLHLSARSYHRILKVARTVADLDDSDAIREEHLAEAIFYRSSGARYWGN